MTKVKFPAGAKSVIDVTKAPYNADNTGKIDCTAVLQKVVNDLFLDYLERFNETKEKLTAMEDPNALITVEIRKINGLKNVIFPECLPTPKIIYFPAGEYLVSDTISYEFQHFKNILADVPHLEMNGLLRFCGEDEKTTTIKLMDHAPLFSFGSERPVISFMQGRASNIAQGNMLENLTIDIGKGNPGAVGVLYFANNSGAVRNVTIRSATGEGAVGFGILHDKVSAGYIKDLTVEGFDYGVKVMPQTHFAAFENLILSNQRTAGIYIGNTMVSIKNLKSNNQVPAVWLHGVTGMTTLVDAELLGGTPLQTAIKYEFGYCLLRNIVSAGYASALSPKIAFGSFTKAIFGDKIEEYYSHPQKNAATQTTLNLSAEDTPKIPWPAEKEWACVNDFGAVGDGKTDDTAAIQSALKSGSPAIWFQPGQYLVNGPLNIPATVTRLNFMYSDLVSGPQLKKMQQTGLLVVSESAEQPLIIEDLFAFEKFNGFMRLVEHAAKRTLVLSDIHCQTAGIYFNTVSGSKVFIENVASTIGGIPGAGNRKHKLLHEDDVDYSRATPCFHFIKQEVYCRLVNAERSLKEMVNDGGKLWVLGFKTEEEGTAFLTENHGQTEVLGGVHAVGLAKDVPLIVNENSDVSIFSSMVIYSQDRGFPIIAKEVKAGAVHLVHDSDFPQRFMNSYALAPYISKLNN